MPQDVFLEQLRQMLWVSTITSMPILGVALVVGLVIGLVQAITSIQEQTLSFVPKVLAIGVTLVILGHWMLGTLIKYTVDLFSNLPAFGAL